MLQGCRESEEFQAKSLNHPAHISEKRVGSLSVIDLLIDDTLVTKRGMYKYTYGSDYAVKILRSNCVT